MRCIVDKVTENSLRTIKEKAWRYQLSLGVCNACQNDLCLANDTTKAETVAVPRSSIQGNFCNLIFIFIVKQMSVKSLVSCHFVIFFCQ